ncbi:hypothetical protein M422DRAFT_781017 [Sphaerobolus stellatus SS14]|uniref:Exocyst complex component EXO84 n=1 Tax=Sphaerobolus stellatus (strain SS14) TaxID=990650 RepID=A0A0C9VDF8_SPHS4|nr:hypothetical protein M422DRAFT_781017 [Sphaerobolus stellatus SS14]
MSLRKKDANNETRGAVPRPRPQKRLNKGGRVEDRIKQRMSMRYADISGPTGLSIPNIPALPIGTRGIVSERIDEGEKEGGAFGGRENVYESIPRGIDTKAMEQEKFDPEAYLKLMLANSTEAELKSLRSSLMAAKEATQTDLKKSVFNNYEQFVSISKEISTLENDLLELKQSLSEWKSMPSLLQVEDDGSDRRRITRSSVADLRTLYANQLQTLHSQVEGSAKFVPIIPGRHVVAEFGEIASLNSATYKIENAVHFVLLDDLFLVARRRQRRTAGGGGRLVADKCWQLGNVVLQDVKDSAEVTNVIKVRHQKETYVYRMERAKDKKSLLSSFRQAFEELAARKRKEREDDHERRRSVWVDGSDPFKLPEADAMPALPDWLKEIAGQGGMTDAKEKAERDARWIEDFCDDLTVAIALREWENAVILIEDGEKRISTVPLLTPKLNVLKTQLTTDLLHALSDPMQRKTSVIFLTRLLDKLQAGALTRSTFLGMRRELMKKRIRALRFEGSVELYISDLAIVVFTGIKHTADWFLESFRERETASSLVQWAKEQIETFAEMFRKQVHGSDVSPQTLQDCLEVTRLQAKRHLKDNSLDFSHLLEHLLISPEPPISPPAFARRPSPSTPTMASELTSSQTITIESPRPARPPRGPPPRSRDRPGSAAGSPAPSSPSTPKPNGNGSATPRRDGMF